MVVELDEADIQRIAQCVSDRITSGSGQKTEIVTVSRAAEYLGGISPKTLYSWINDGKVPAYNLGGKKGRLVLRTSDLDRFIDSSKRN